MLVPLRSIIDRCVQRRQLFTPQKKIDGLMLKNILVILHVITAASWFGLALILGAIARETVAERASGLLDVGAKVERFMMIFIVLTFVFGFSALFAGGGFAFYGPLYHTSILLILILILVQFFVIRPGWRSLSAGDDGAEASRKKLAMGTGIGHLLWLVVLIMMFWNHYPLW